MILKQNININSKKVHKCSICKENFFWNEESCWYGYDADEKGCEKVLEKCCNKACFDKSKRKNKRFM